MWWEACVWSTRLQHLLELELILSQMAQKPMLRGEVGARALRVRSDVRGHLLRPALRASVWGSARVFSVPPKGSVGAARVC